MVQLVQETCVVDQGSFLETSFLVGPDRDGGRSHQTLPAWPAFLNRHSFGSKPVSRPEGQSTGHTAVPAQGLTVGRLRSQ